MRAMLRLGVNIDHVATLREARYRGQFSNVAEPDPLAAAQACVDAGAHSITTHLREDRRHIQVGDVLTIRHDVHAEFNLEMAATEPMVDFALRLKPDDACLVPENRQEITTEGGLNIKQHEKKVALCVKRLRHEGIRVSLFIDPDPRQIQSAVHVGASCIELHTGRFANAISEDDQKKALDELIKVAQLAYESNLQVNAGHGLNYKNLPALLEVPYLHTLNIGHSIISRSILVGIPQAVQEMLDLMQNY